MKTIPQALALSILFCGLAFAQTGPAASAGPAGKWRGEGQGVGNLTLELKVDGTNLTGLLAVGAAPGTEISDGRIDGNRIAFKIQIPNGGRTVIFNGVLKGDEIAFTREVKVPEGAQLGGNVGGPIFSVTGPDEFAMIREATANAWSGTIRQAPTPRNPNPAPNPRPVTLGIRKVTTPHWRWRGGDTQYEVRTFTLPMGTFELGTFDLEGDKLAFSFTRPGPGDEVKCSLARQPEGQFKGSCQMGNGQNTQLLELTPPGVQKPAAAAATR